MTSFADRMIDDAEFASVYRDDPRGIVCLDTETTGLKFDRDGIISLAIVDCDLESMFDSLIHTYRKTVWPEAYRVNRISPRDVRDAPSVPMIRDEVEDILAKAKVIVGYNIVGFDLPMMESNGFEIPDVGIYDVMDGFYRAIGPDGRHSLSDCSRWCGLDPDIGRLHTAIGDARMTMKCARIVSGLTQRGDVA